MTKISPSETPSPWLSDYARWIEAGTAASTRRAYSRDVAYFWDWADTQLGLVPDYPAPVEAVLQFCLWHLDPASPRPLKVSSLRRYLASLSVAHHEAGLPSPVQDPRVGYLIKKVKAAKQERANQKAAITTQILEGLIATCDDSLKGVRDKAILLVGFYGGGRRRAELVNLAVDDLQATPEGYRLTIMRSKTDQLGNGLTVPLTGEAAMAVKAWLLHAGIRDGKLFRGLKPDGTLHDSLSGKNLNKMIKQRIEHIGLDPAQFGAHSLRAGFITSSVARGKLIEEVMLYSGHRDRETAQRYIRLSGSPLQRDESNQ